MVGDLGFLGNCLSCYGNMFFKEIVVDLLGKLLVNC